MKSIVKVLAFIPIVVLICQCEKDEPNPEVTFLDENFLTALIEQGIDTDGDSIISPAEAEAVSSLSLCCRDISDMSGIEIFVNLEYLY